MHGQDNPKGPLRSQGGGFLIAQGTLPHPGSLSGTEHRLDPSYVLLWLLVAL